MNARKITKNNGTTRTEKELAYFANATFLELWSYPNPYRDQKKRSEQGDGKEICDLLVVCGDDVLIFSDKEIKFNNTVDIELGWKRWYKKAIRKSVDQVNGAERWLRNHPEQVFLDKKCTRKFPLKIPSESTARYHRIIVARGLEKDCSRYFGGGRGSLMQSTAGSSDETLNKKLVPFNIPDVQPDEGYVHVLDDCSLSILFSELDTITDFLTYLNEKEKYMRSGKKILIAGEEELLAAYLENRIDDRVSFIPRSIRDKQDLQIYLYGTGSYGELVDSDIYKRKKKADKVSYGWDDLVNNFSLSILDGASDIDINDAEKALRILAEQNRFRRRVFSQHIMNSISHVPDGQALFRPIVPFEGDLKNELIFLFLQLSRKGIFETTSNEMYKKYREFRRKILKVYCGNLRADYPTAKNIIGVAQEPIIDGLDCTYDLISYKDRLSPAETQYVRDEAKTLCIYKKETLTMMENIAYEYPASSEQSVGKKGRKKNGKKKRRKK